MVTAFRPPSWQLAPYSKPGALWHPPKVYSAVLRRNSDVTVIQPETLPLHRRFTPICVLLLGRRGAGKTLGMTALGWFLHRAYLKAGGFRKVMANYHVGFANLVHPYLIDELNGFPAWGHDSLCLVDEIAAYAPGRRSLARTNVDLATFLQQVRKRRMDFIFTTQFPQVLDQQVLMQIDLFVQVELHAGGCGAQGHRYCLDMVTHDWWGQWTGNMMLRRWPPDRNDHDWTMTLHDCRRVFNKYNSNEVIAPIWSRNRANIIAGEGHRLGDAGGQPPLGKTSLIPSKVQGQAAPELRLMARLIRQGSVFTLGPLLNMAQGFMPSITSMETFALWLGEHGWQVRQDRNIWTAERAV